MKKAIENNKHLKGKDYNICHVLSLYAIDYYDLYNCIECYDPDFEDAMDDVLDYLFNLSSKPGIDIGWVRLPIA